MGLTEQRRRRRAWSDEEERQILIEAQADEAKVAVVARRHEANANMVLKRLRDPQFGDGQATAEFLSVEVASNTVDPATAQDVSAPLDRSRLLSRLALEERAGIIEIDLACDARVSFDAHVNDRAMLRVRHCPRAGLASGRRVWLQQKSICVF